jgi:hypothetical protein
MLCLSGSTSNQPPCAAGSHDSGVTKEQGEVNQGAVNQQEESKIYEDGRTLSLQVVDEKLVEKSLTYSWAWDYNVLEKERETGATVQFKWYENNGLEVGMTYYGTYLVGKMVSLTAESKVKYPHIFQMIGMTNLNQIFHFPSSM